jgi:nucleolar protein 56
MPADSFKIARERMLKGTREAIKVAYSNEEHSLIQAINAYNESNKLYNTVNERLSEWFGVYFPDVTISSPKAIAEISIMLSRDGRVSKEGLETALNDKDKADEIYTKMSEEAIRKISAEEFSSMAAFARLSNSADESLKSLESYIDQAAKRILPNTTYLTESKIAAELLAKAGSMERFANMPASTIQLLGAEKALFKHIKFGSKPPKYGVLFKFPAIGNARKDIRGRLARTYAAKIGIAIKADHFSKNFIAEMLKTKLDESVKRITESPVVEKKQYSYQQGGRRFGGGKSWGSRRDNNNRKGNNSRRFHKNPNRIYKE